MLTDARRPAARAGSRAASSGGCTRRSRSSTGRGSCCSTSRPRARTRRRARAILDAVATLAADGTAVVYTTHYLPEVEALDADVALLEAGRIIASGTVAELVARARGERRSRSRSPTGASCAARAPRCTASSDDVIRAEVIRPSLEAAYLALTGRRSAE